MESKQYLLLKNLVLSWSSCNNACVATTISILTMFIPKHYSHSDQAKNEIIKGLQRSHSVSGIRILPNLDGGWVFGVSSHLPDCSEQRLHFIALIYPKESNIPGLPTPIASLPLMVLTTPSCLCNIKKLGKKREQIYTKIFSTCFFHVHQACSFPHSFSRT